MGNAGIGFMLGFLACLLLVASQMLQSPTLEQCHASNPGFDCTLGWVKGEAFKAN